MNKDKREAVNIFVVTIIALILLLWAALGHGGSRVIIKQYDKDYNITGYSVIENGRESHFSKDWNRTGYSVYEHGRDRINHFDLDWNRQGHDELKYDEKREN